MPTYDDDAAQELDSPIGIVGVYRGGAGADMSAASGFWMQLTAGAAVTTSAFPEFNVRHYGAVGDGVTDDTTAFEAAWNAAIAAGRGTIYMPDGVYLITRALPAFVGLPIRVRGNGAFSTSITWNPSSGTNPALMTWQPLPDQSTLNFVEADHFAIYTGNSYTKVGIRSIGTAYASSFHHLRIQLLHAGDTAHEIQGWDTTHISDVFYNASRPIYIKKVTAGASTGAGQFDHFTFTNCFLQSYDNLQPLIDVETGVTVSNLTFNGDQAWVGGYDGFKFVSTGGAFNVSFSNVRWENSGTQISSPSLHGYMFDIDPTTASADVTFINCRGGAQGQQGWKLRNLSRINLIATNFQGSWSSAFDQINVDSTNNNLLFLNAVFSNAANAVRTINAALVEAFGGPVVTGTTPSFGYWQKSAGTVRFGSGVTVPASGISVTGGQVSSSTQHRCNIYKSAAQSIDTATITPITFDTETTDVGVMHDTSTNSERITIPTGGDGFYLIIGKIVYATNATGSRQIRLNVNGNERSTLVSPANAGAGETTTLDHVIAAQLAATNYVSMSAYQTSGGALDVSGGTLNTRLILVKLW